MWREHGGPGITDTIWLRLTHIINSLMSSLNGRTDYGRTMHKLLGLDEEGCWTAMLWAESKAGLHPIFREFASALKALSVSNECSYAIDKDQDGRYRLLKNGAIIPFGSTHLKTISDNIHLRLLLKCKNQGRYWETLQHTPTTTRDVYNFHTKLCDWRFIRRARMNLTPLKGAITCMNTTKTCRRCQQEDETLTHVTNSCTFHKKRIIARHNAFCDHIEKWLPDDATYYKEQRFGNLQPDLGCHNHSRCKGYHWAS